MNRFAKLGAAVLLFSAACGGDSNTNADMGGMAAPTFTVPSTCTQATVTAAMIYPNIIAPNCAIAGCHVSGSTSPNYGPDVTAFKQNTVGVSAGRSQQPTLDYAKANDLNNSLIVYKINNQQAKIQFGGNRMPDSSQGKAALSDADQCAIINWIRSGAN